MTKCGCETGLNCTKTTVCQCELVADKLAEALAGLLDHDFSDQCQECGSGQSDEWAGARSALKEYRG